MKCVCPLCAGSGVIDLQLSAASVEPNTALTTRPHPTEVRETLVEDSFLAEFRTLSKLRKVLSPERKSKSYAPRLFCRGTSPGDPSQAEYAAAMQSLIRKGLLTVVSEGRPSHRRKRLVQANTGVFDD